jgi:hypothetical protein
MKEIRVAAAMVAGLLLQAGAYAGADGFPAVAVSAAHRTTPSVYDPDGEDRRCIACHSAPDGRHRPMLLPHRELIREELAYMAGDAESPFRKIEMHQ